MVRKKATSKKKQSVKAKKATKSVRCASKTKEGKRCKRMATGGRKNCTAHGRKKKAA